MTVHIANYLSFFHYSVIAFVASVLECGTAVFFIPWWFRTSLAWKTGNTNLSFSARCIMSFSVTMYAILLFFGLPLAVGIEIGTKAEGTDCSVDATDPVCQIGTIHLFTNAYCQSLSWYVHGRTQYSSHGY